MVMVPLRSALWSALAFVMLGLGALPAIGGEYQAGGIKVTDLWVRESPIGSNSGGGYLRITNTGKEADRLVGAETQAAKRVEVREVVPVGEVMQMRVLPNGLEIPPGASIQLRWESYHLLFVGLKEPFKRDESLDALLHFSKAGTVPVKFEIRPRVYW